MVSNVWNIFVKLFSVLLVLIMMYILAVFLFPDFADSWGNADLNAKIRQIKNTSDSISSSDGTLKLPF